EASFEEPIDTTLLPDGKITISLEAIDEAGNTSVIEENYTVDQSTDKPVIKFSNGKDSTVIKDFDKVNKTQNTFGVETNNKAVFNFTDDDGLEKVTITLLDKDGKTVDASVVQIQENQKEPINPVVYTFDGSTTALVNYILPKKEGMYILEVEAVDVEYNNVSDREDADKVKTYRTSKTKNYIAVSDSNFNIKFNSANIINDEGSTQKFETTIKGIVTVSAEEKIKSIERYEITQDKNGEWVKGSLVSSYKNDATPEKNTIKITKDANSSYVQWKEIVPVDKMQEGVKNFRYIATDTTDVSVSIDLKWNVDDTLPELHKNAYTESNADKWLNSTSQTLIYIVRDKESNGYASGIDSVKYSFKNGENPTEGYFARGASCDENGNTDTETKDWILYKTTFDLPEGKSTLVTVTVSDKVGNTSSATKLNLKIDTNAPVVSVTPSITGGQVLQNSKTIPVTFGYTDATSGLKCVEFSTDSSMKNNLVTLTETKSVSSYDYPLSGLSDGTYSIYVRATDNAGNKSEAVLAGEVIVDTIAPKVEIKTPVSGATVNKTISFAGTVSDNNLPAGSVPVLWYNDGTEWKKVYNVSPYSTSLSGQEWTITGVDTTKLNNTTSAKDFEFLVVFTDKAENSNDSVEKYPYKLTIDQNADRPVIKFTNINLDGSSKVSSKEILGVISDDDGVSEKDADGISTKIKLYRIDSADYDDDSETNKTPSTSGNKWKSISVEAGTGIWTAKITDDEKEGKKHWYFYVIDEAGGEFCTKSTSLLERPYFTDGSNKIDDTDGINFSYDLTPPDVEISVAHDNEFTQNDTIFGEKHNIYIRAIVKEAVGMNADDPVKLVIGNGEKIQPAGYPKLLSSNEEAGKTVYIYEFEPVSIGDNNYPAGTLSISVTAKDAANLSNKDMMNITIDKDAPTVKIISPTTALSDAVSSSVSIKGIVQDDKSSIAKLEYVIPKEGVLDSSQEWKAMGTSASWDITFASGAPDSSDSLIYYAVAENSGA
ncbi:MAG: Ig-like domain-containing protein, partial [Treponema sp.]|nr:Ig-like domain-containing protein [Treponema sp.]